MLPELEVMAELEMESPELFLPVPLVEPEPSMSMEPMPVAWTVALERETPWLVEPVPEAVPTVSIEPSVVLRVAPVTRTPRLELVPGPPVPEMVRLPAPEEMLSRVELPEWRRRGCCCRRHRCRRCR